MNATAKFPLDLTERAVFRALKQNLGATGRTLQFFWLLWRDLAHLVIEGHPLGKMKPAQQEALIALLADELAQIKHLTPAISPSLADSQSGEAEALSAFREFLMVSVVEAGLLVRDGDDLHCPLFVNLNGDLAQRANPSRGGLTKVFNGRQKKSSSLAQQQLMQLPDNIWALPDGTAMTEDQIERVQRFVYSCDNALYRERPPIGWTPQLVTLAHQLASQLSDAQIESTCKRIAMSKGHTYLLHMTTEKLLARPDAAADSDTATRFEKVLGEIGEA